MAEEKELLVWDGLVRFLHWALVLLFCIAYASGDDGGALHRWVGIAIVLLVAVRLLWGIVGSRHARFSQFVRSPATAWRYLRDLFRGRPDHYLGHNPAAAWMIVFLLAGSLAVSASGALICFEKGSWGRGLSVTEMFIGDAWADDHRQRQLHRSGGKGGHGHREREGESPWKEVHETLAAIFLGLIITHIAGVVASSLVHGENLLKSMVTGRKTLRG